MLSLLPEVISHKKATFLSSQLPIFILVTWTPRVDFPLLSWYSTNVKSLIKSNPDISIMLPTEPLHSSHNEIFLKSWSPHLTCYCLFRSCVNVNTHTHAYTLTHTQKRKEAKSSSKCPEILIFLRHWNFSYSINELSGNYFKYCAVLFSEHKS